jgi:hypothetical protein
VLAYAVDGDALLDFGSKEIFGVGIPPGFADSND